MLCRRLLRRLRERFDLIFLDHSFAHLLKAGILAKGGKIREPRQANTIGFESASGSPLTTNKTTAAIRVLGIKDDPDCYQEVAIEKVKYQRYQADQGPPQREDS
jgi:hypothetical protein